MAEIFINYRRTGAFFAERIEERLREAFDEGAIFLDRSAVRPGETFPERIEKEIRSAQIVLVVIDPTWISVQDEETFKRRLDLESDWVRRELELAYDAGALVIPVLMGDTPMPTVRQLPESLSYLATMQAVTLNPTAFADGVERLILEMKDRLGEADFNNLIKDTSSRFPKPARYKPQPVEGEQLAAMMEELPDWRVVESPFSTDAGTTGTQREIVRDFRFPSFLRAIEFMRVAADSIDRLGHHPRWENIFRTVTVHYSTWDIGHQPSDRDRKSAEMLDRIYKEFISGTAGRR